MAARTRLFICFACLLPFPGMVFCQTAKDYLVTAQRSGVIQFRNPTTLDIVSTIDVNLPANSTGINGVFADPNGRMLYIEGPEHTDPSGASGCCWLYSVDLPSVQARVAAGIWGSKSRRYFVNAGSSLLTAVSDAVLAAIQVEGDQWQISPNGRWWAGLRRGPSVDLYDASRNKIVRSFTAAKGNPDWHLNGAWIKDQFYIYTTHGGSGWLWHLSPDSDGLGEPVAVPSPIPIQGCENAMVVTAMSAVGDRLVLNEVFGSQIDRRQQCDGVSGGAWIIDPASKQSDRNLVRQLYFWQLLPSPDGTSLYGLTSEASATGVPSQLVHLDVDSGKILASQLLEGGHWWIAVASLHTIPPLSRSLVLPVDNTR